MTGLDSAIRNAIERAGARDSAARERVYGSARAAFERSMAERADLDEATVEAQRHRFDAIVREIEAEKTGIAVTGAPRPGAREPADTAARSPVRSVFPSQGATDAPEIVSAPGDRLDAPAGEGAPSLDVSPSRRHQADTAPRVEAVASPAAATPAPGFRGSEFPELDDAAPAAPVALAETKQRRRGKAGRIEARKAKLERKRQKRRRRGTVRLFSALFLLVSLFAFVAIGLWLLNATGLVGQSATGGSPSSFSKFDSGRGGGAPDLVTGNGFGEAWTPIFVPGDADAIVPGPAASAKAVDSERGKAVRLQSTTPGADGDIRIVVPAGVLDRMAGTSATIALSLRGVDGKATRIALECDFAAMGGCSRRRFEVNPEMTDVVFRIREQKAAAPGGPGYLLLNTDFDGKGRSIDLFAIGLRNGE